MFLDFLKQSNLYINFTLDSLKFLCYNNYNYVYIILFFFSFIRFFFNKKF